MLLAQPPQAVYKTSARIPAGVDVGSAGCMRLNSCVAIEGPLLQEVRVGLAHGPRSNFRL
eukprot:35163-Eustigmatos_ZCMA.PRE.1